MLSTPSKNCTSKLRRGIGFELSQNRTRGKINNVDIHSPRQAVPWNVNSLEVHLVCAETQVRVEDQRRNEIIKLGQLLGSHPSDWVHPNDGHRFSRASSTRRGKIIITSYKTEQLRQRAQDKQLCHPTGLTQPSKKK
jgi:hypothetical protein